MTGAERNLISFIYSFYQSEQIQRTIYVQIGLIRVPRNIKETRQKAGFGCRNVDSDKAAGGKMHRNKLLLNGAYRLLACLRFAKNL